MREGDTPARMLKTASPPIRGWRDLRFEREGPGGASQSWAKRRPKGSRKKTAAGDQIRAMQPLPWVADAGTRDPTFGTGSRT